MRARASGAQRRPQRGAIASPRASFEAETARQVLQIGRQHLKTAPNRSAHRFQQACFKKGYLLKLFRRKPDGGPKRAKGTGANR